MNRAFTLIELLTVTAILAILGSVLFPVFGQERSRSHETICLSNVRRLALSLEFYARDFDDWSPPDKTPLHDNSNGNRISGGPWYDLMGFTSPGPIGTLYCPDRTLIDGNQRYYDSYSASGNYYEPGYGYDDGFVSDSGFGLSEQYYINGELFRPGKPLSLVVNPSGTVSIGDSNDLGSMSSAGDNIFAGPDGPANTSAIRHSGSLNFAFVDGHAGRVAMVAGVYTDPYGDQFRVGRAASYAQALGWCYDPNASSDYAGFDSGIGAPGSSYPVNSINETCSQVVTDWFDPTYFAEMP